MAKDDTELIYLDKEKREFRGITRELLNQWELDYPWIHVTTQLRKCARWMSKGNRSRNINRLAPFIEHWFKKAQGGNPKKYRSFKRKGLSTPVRDVVADALRELKKGGGPDG